MVLAYYEDDNQTKTKAIKLPDEKVDAVDRQLSARKGIKISSVLIPDERIIGIFEDEQWKNLQETLLAPVPAEPKTWDELKEQVKRMLEEKGAQKTQRRKRQM